MTRRERQIFYALVMLGMGIIFAFGIEWFRIPSIPHNFRSWWHILDIVLYLCVTYVVWFQICTEVMLWMIVEKIQDPKPQQPAPGLKVAFITTFVPSSEPLDLLKKILPALKQADYPHDVWLLDEGNSEAARKLCEHYGVNYFTRGGVDKYNTDGGQFAAKTKGGNHNAWYDMHGHAYDIVAQIDTDFIPRRDFLTKTLGYFNDPSVGFVGTPQIYGNTYESFVARGAAEQQYTFYGPILRGLHGRDMMMLIGANHIVRVRALQDIDYYGAHLTEDLLTGMTLHSQKWTSVYVPEALAVGEGPATWSAYFNQQMRWAFGCIDILFRHSPKMLRQMSLEQRRYYFMLLQHYFSGLALAMGVVILVLNFVCGINATAMSLKTVFVYALLISWQYVISIWLQRYNIRPRHERGFMLAGKVVSIAALPIYFLALFGVLRGKRLSFKVTPKGSLQASHTPLRIFTPHIMTGLILALALGWSFKTHEHNPFVTFWAVLTIGSMLGIAFMSWGYSLVKARRGTRRYMYTTNRLGLTPANRRLIQDGSQA